MLNRQDVKIQVPAKQCDELLSASAAAIGKFSAEVRALIDKAAEAQTKQEADSLVTRANLYRRDVEAMTWLYGQLAATFPKEDI